MKKHYDQKNGDKSCQSNFDKRPSDFGSFLDILLLQYCIAFKNLDQIT